MMKNRVKGRGIRMVLFAVLAFAGSCGGRSDEPGSGGDSAHTAPVVEAVDDACVLPTDPTTVREDGAAVLLVWELPASGVYEQFVLPADSAFLAYRAAIRADGGDLQRPIADEPDTLAPGMAEIWRNERFNQELAQSGAAGSIQPITCLDALFFSYQNSRIPQLEKSTEFLMSVLRREISGQTDLVVVFGAGDELFPPKSVYGFDVVDEYLSEGWRYWYALHNHTLQRNGDRWALGNPTLSTSDVQLTRAVVAERGLESARVTNGFYTFSVMADELGPFRSR